MDNLKKGTEGSSLGKMNLFIAGPQILSSIAVGYLINKSPLKLETGITNHWEYAFIVAGITMFIASLITLTLQKEQLKEDNLPVKEEELVTV
jgi:hypothetical protein